MLSIGLIVLETSLRGRKDRRREMCLRIREEGNFLK